MSNKITQTHVVDLVLLTFNPRPPVSKIVSRPPKEWGGYHPPLNFAPGGKVGKYVVCTYCLAFYLQNKTILVQIG